MTLLIISWVIVNLDLGIMVNNLYFMVKIGQLLIFYHCNFLDDSEGRRM